MSIILLNQMAIDGLILLDSNTGSVGFHPGLVLFLTNQLSRPIIQSGFRSTSSLYPLIHIDAYNNALSKVSRPDDVDPVVYVPAYNIAESPSACCHVQCADMRFLCPISGNGTSSVDVTDELNRDKISVDPLFGFAFLQTFIDILHEYFGDLSAATLKDNFDIVYQVRNKKLNLFNRHFIFLAFRGNFRFRRPSSDNGPKCPPRYRITSLSSQQAS